MNVFGRERRTVGGRLNVTVLLGCQAERWETPQHTQLSYLIPFFRIFGSAQDVATAELR